MRITKEDLARQLDRLMSDAALIDQTELSTIERRLLDCISVLSVELVERIQAGPLKRIVIEHDLHKLAGLPMLRDLGPHVLREVVALMEDPSPDGVSSNDECESVEKVSP
jgi:hypothetical protein